MNTLSTAYKPAEGNGLCDFVFATDWQSLHKNAASVLPSVFILEVELWSGLKKGPPRKLKFPEPSKVVEILKGNLD
ncbi:hypothetical protein JD844_022168 [Phrynosoma platyrhinos]|uniref:Uncharacterized protein n=1 Tax=Phrynosoma platyrhinos TaxID=52577 RepID=A0ABQ7SUU0_PHRPL|nr:hypothetical protein JD844_022168 [Phrynosoma platyrhinos]